MKVSTTLASSGLPVIYVTDVKPSEVSVLRSIYGMSKHSKKNIWFAPGYLPFGLYVLEDIREYDNIANFEFSKKVIELEKELKDSAQKIQACSEDELFALAKQRLQKVMATGTGAIELKSGYGLSVEGELKMLRVIKRLKNWSPIPIKATFLGAHAYPQEFKENHQGYIDLLLNTLLPQISAEGLADYMDVFCEQGFFSLDETNQILTAAAKVGLKPKIHANQLSASGAVELAVRHQALSVDHLEEMNAAAEDALANSNTIATLLPTCSLFLGIPFANARRLLAKNVCLALASDYNPGSSPSGNMNLVVSLACMRQKMLPEEAINAATLNGAAAMELSDMYGSLSVGKVANFFYTKALPSLAYLPYSFGENLIEGVFINGKRYENE